VGWGWRVNGQESQQGEVMLSGCETYLHHVCGVVLLPEAESVPHVFEVGQVEGEREGGGRKGGAQSTRGGRRGGFSWKGGVA